MAIQNSLIEIDTSADSYKTSTSREFEKSFLTMALLLGIGMLLEYITPGNGIKLPQLPYSAYLGGGFIAFVFMLYFNYRKTGPIRWLTGIPAAISAVAGYILCLTCLNLVPQNNETSGILNDLGLTHIKLSFEFLFIHVYLLTILGFTILSHISPFKWKNMPFFLSHTGLWLIITAAGLGSADLRRVNINLLENGMENDIGISASNEMVKLPFALKLIDFTIEEYTPIVSIISKRTRKQVTRTIQPHIELRSRTVFNFNKWYIYITKYIPNAIYNDSTYESSDLPDSFPAAFIEVVDIKQKKKRDGWITSGNIYREPQYFQLDSSQLIQLFQPKIKHFYSKLIISDSTRTDTLIIKANKPIPIKDWLIYQSGYDLAKGKWSTLSVLEAVHDPWIKLIYAGITLLIIGILLIVWTGKIKQQ